ncbi:hypothetical protein BC830DRAFT_199485 [Chytriomyces sp. MP71]|nr:hypothetical protein BC830DRAFT_199485 [Chytriomyces sp. MP71]
MRQTRFRRSSRRWGLTRGSVSTTRERQVLFTTLSMHPSSDSVKTPSIGYGYSFTRPDEVFLSKHDVSLDNWEDEDNDTNSRSNRKSRRAKTAKQREGKRASISTGAKKKAGQVLTPEEEFLREYGSSEEDKVADEDEPDEDGSGKLPDEPSTTKRKHFRLSDSDDSDNEDVNASTSSVCNKIGSSGGQESFVVESSDSDAEYNGKSGKKQHELQISDEDGDDLSGAEILEGKRTTRSRVDRKAMAAYHKARGSQPPSSTRKRNMVISDDQGDETAPKVWVCTPSRRFVRKRDTMARVKIDEVQDDFIINFSD